MLSTLRSLIMLLVIFLPALAAGEAQIIHLQKPPGMDRADLAYIQLVDNPVAVLVLCPGYNGNAKSMIEREIWMEYARNHRLGLVGLSFSSPENLLADGKGYYLASEGSGQCLLDGIEMAFKKAGLPIFLYGFSGGAHFVGNFAEWNPKRVSGWCSYSAAWWDKPVVRTDEQTPPGIVACGQLDRFRLGASSLFFKQGRALQRPWLWIELEGEDHAWPNHLDAFVKAYFSAIQDGSSSQGIYVDLDSKEIAQSPVPKGQESLYGWLPKSQLLDQWKELYQP